MSVKPLDQATASSRDPLAEVEPALSKLALLGRNDPRREHLRESIICDCTPIARREAARYRHTSEPLDDLVQVATVGLILAVDRFNPGRNIPFRHFALPTITGELKRHFRDKAWGVHVSRRTQELYQEIRGAEPDLAQRLGRTPSTRDIAEHLNLTEEDVCAARTGEAAHAMRSLNWPVSDEGDGSELSDTIGGTDPQLELVPDRDALRRAVVTLPERLRVVLALRFVDELTQSQMADKLGMSQMNVSRLLARAVDRLRQHMLAEQPTKVAA